MEHKFILREKKMGKVHKYSAGGKKMKEAQPEAQKDDKLTMGKVKQIQGVKKRLVKKKIEELRKEKKKLSKRALPGQERSKEIRREIKKLMEDQKKESEALVQAVKDSTKEAADITGATIMQKGPEIMQEAGNTMQS